MSQTQLEWIDTHAHLDHQYPFSLEEYLTNAKNTGVSKLITIGTTPDTLTKLSEISERYPNVYFTVGIHPHDAKLFSQSVEVQMDGLRKHPKCVAVGEIGLDYYYKHSSQDVQRQAFEQQLKLARRWQLPIVIHTRDAEEDTLKFLKDHVEKPLKKLPGVIHCFTGTANFAEECIKLGFYISFSGIVTFKKTDALRLVVAQTPLERILIETDAPFLAPVPFRGKPNQSAYLIETAKCIAEIKKISLEELSRVTVENSMKVFGLK